MSDILLTAATGLWGSNLLKDLLNNTECDIIILKRSFSNVGRIVEYADVKIIKSYDIDCVDLETNLMFPVKLLDLSVQIIKGVN